MKRNKLFAFRAIFVLLICGFILSCNSDIPVDDEPAGPVLASYKVEYYFQNVADDNYTLEDVYTKTLEGKIGEATTEEAATFTGFTACTFDQQKIAEDGSTVVKINYNRNKYKITFDTDGGSQMDPVSLKYEAPITAPAEPTKDSFTFYHWDKALPDKMPAEDLSIKAQWCIRSSVADLGTALSVATDPNEVYNIVITDKNIDDFLIDYDGFYSLPLPSKYAFDLSECTETTGIPDNKYIEGIFFENPSLFGIILPSSITILEGYDFFNCGNLISVKLNENLETIGYRVFYGCKNLENIIIPSTVTTISNHVFAECSNLKSIVIPAGVETIGKSAFQNCTNLTDITISEGVKNINDFAFQECYSFETITFPASVEYIGEGSFNGNNLKEVVIPAGVKSIGCDAFGSNPLTKLTFEDPTGWYKTSSETDWEAKTGGEAVDLSNPATNAAKFVTSRDNGYADYYWYKQ